MRILHVVLELSPAYGGPGTVALEHVRQLSKRGHDVTLATTSMDVTRPEDLTDADGVRRLTFPASYSRLPLHLVTRGDFARRTSPELTEWIRVRAGEFDIAHVHFGRDPILVSATRELQRRGVPTFLQTHGMVEPGSGLRRLDDRLRSRRLLRGAVKVFALQAHEERALAAVDGEISVERLPNGIDLDQLAEVVPDEAEGPYVLFAARLHPRKRVAAFVRMASLVSAARPGLRFRVLGADDGDLASARELARELGVARHVAFEGARTRFEVLSAMAGAAAFVIPSVREPFPMALLEAMAIGAPSVIVDSCYIADDLGAAGAVAVTDGTPQQLADAVVEIIDDEARRRALIDAAREVMANRLSSAMVCDGLEGAYRGACPLVPG